MFYVFVQGRGLGHTYERSHYNSTDLGFVGLCLPLLQGGRQGGPTLPV